MIIKIKIAFAFLFLTAQYCFTQTSYKVTNYTSRDGLSNSSVYDLEKDSSGFLWIATELGINKFDGKSFYSYTPNSHNIPDNSIINILVVEKNKLFCTTGTSGYFIFDSQNEKPLPLSVNFSSFVYKSNKTKCVGSKVYIKSLASNYILVFDLRANKMVDTIKAEGSRIDDFETLEDGGIVMVTNNGLKIWQKGITSSYNLNGYNKTRQPIRSFYSTNTNIYFSKGGYVFIYDKFTDSVKDSVKYSSNDVAVNKMLVDKQGNIWFSTHYPAGVYQYNTSERKLIDFTSYLNGTENSVASIIEDDEKNIWVGTYSSGLYKISPSVFNPLPLLKNENVYFAKIDDADRFFVGTQSGLNILNFKTNTTENVNIDGDNGSYIYSVVKTGKKYIVLNNKLDGIRYSKDKTKFQFIRRRSICMINDTLAISGAWSNKVELISLQTDSVKVLASQSLQNSDGNRNRINCFLLDSRQSIWCGTDAGLYILSKDLKTCKKIDGRLFKYAIIDILEDNNSIYIATQKGLVKYSEGKLSIIREINNHPIDKINSLCKDKRGSIFLGTLNGLFKISPNGIDNYFDEDDGLISKEINKVVYNPFTNSVLIATNEGLCEFNLYQFKYLGNSIPKIHFTKVTSTGEITYRSGVYNLKNRNVNIYFGSIGFRHPASIGFRWRADENPYHYIHNPSIEFAAMTYGKHVIEISVSNDGNNWSLPLVIKLNVETPYYRSNWFLVIGSLVLLALIGLVFKLRTEKIRREAGLKAELEQKLVSLKYEALNASINPHFIFNALNSVQHYINTNRNDEASDYLAKFGFLIRQTLENATEHFISINDEIERLKMYMDLEKVRFNEGFAYEIKIDPSLNIYKKKIPNMILQPLIENSIIHGFKQIEYLGYIHLQFVKVGQELMIIIEDNGRGLVKSKNIHIHEKDKKKSIALENVKERIKTVPKATIKISDKSYLNKRGTGVLIEITLPFNLH